MQPSFAQPADAPLMNETSTPFNYLETPTDVVLLVVFWHLRYKLSLRDVAEMFLARGFVFTHDTVRDWEERFAPLIAEHLRKRRSGEAGTSWYVDETYLKVHGKWCYLYRAIDRDGNLVDSRLSEKRDMDAAKQFFRYCQLKAMMSLFYPKSGEEGACFGLFSRRIIREKPKKPSRWGKLIRRNNEVDNTFCRYCQLDNMANRCARIAS